MPLITSEKMLLHAQKNGYAVGAFNFENAEMLTAIIAAAEELNAPVMLQTTPSTVRYFGLRLYSAMVKALADESPVPIALHLDHGDSYELAAEAIKAGYTSVMIDGSAFPFADNVEVTKKVVAAARSFGLPVEAELGKVGGKEDDHASAGDMYTDPAEAAEFVMQTGINSLAVAIGTAHGPYSAGVPKLDVDRLREIRKVVDIPLVLHGASGLYEEQVRECIGAGICKVNFATELRMAYTDGVKKTLAQNASVYDPKAYGKAGRKKDGEIVKSRIIICGSDQKAGML